MLAFLLWLVVGLVAGAVARFLIPGRQPMSWVMTMILGLVGSIVGGAISMLIFGQDPTNPGFHPGGLLMSIVGAVIVLGAYVGLARRSTI